MMSGVLWMMSLASPPAFGFLVHALHVLGTSFTFATIEPPKPLTAFWIVTVAVVGAVLRLGDLDGLLALVGCLALDELAGSSSASSSRLFPTQLGEFVADPATLVVLPFE